MGEKEAHLKKTINARLIQESISEWASSPVLIRTHDGTVRWCIDYRCLNNVTVKDVFPLAKTIVLIQLPEMFGFLSLMPIPLIKPEDRHKTAFHTRYGLYKHVKMGFGLCNAPATYARVINLVTLHLNWKTLLAFLYDVLILGKTFEDHLGNLGEALRRFSQYGLKLKAKKGIFFPLSSGITWQNSQRR